MKIATPSTEMIHCIADDARNRLISEAITRPITPMVRNDPTPVRSRFVTYPHRLMLANIAEVAKNARAISSPAKTRKIEAMERPMLPQNAQNNACAVEAFIEWRREFR